MKGILLGLLFNSDNERLPFVVATQSKDINQTSTNLTAAMFRLVIDSQQQRINKMAATKNGIKTSGSHHNRSVEKSLSIEKHE